MLTRFFVYGFLGWATEILFTGASSVLVERDASATAKTYLWMHPIYGAAGLLLEWMSKKLEKVPSAVRPLAYLPVIYGVEYATGWALRKALGKCPWDYSGRGYNVHGLVRLDYAPAWLAAGFLFEPLADRVRHATRPISAVATAAVEAAKTEAREQLALPA